MSSLRAQAQDGLLKLELAVEGLLERHPDGLTNAEIAESLGITTAKPYKNMLSWTILGRLIEAGRVERHRTGKAILLRLRRE
jgi:hypothetical protein